jgi:mannose-6-phosphate isomerase-like protein (cupin superfamily)
MTDPSGERPARRDVAFATLRREGGERFQTLRRELGVSSFGMNLIVLAPGERGRIHSHERQEEVYLVLEGRLTLIVEGEESELGQSELIRVAPRIRRQLVNRAPERLVLLALGGEGEHRGRDGEAFASWDDQVGVAPQELPLPADLDPKAADPDARSGE